MNKDVNKIRLNNIKKKNCVIVTGRHLNNFSPHFPHSMEYFYYATDIILDNSCVVIVREPPVPYKSNYVISFIEKMYRNFENFIFLEWSYPIEGYKTFIYEHQVAGKGNKNMIKDKYLINYPYTGFEVIFKEIEHEYYNWFPYKNSLKMRDLFIENKKHKKFIKIGLINRKKNRILKNYQEICEKIFEKFNIEVDITYFDDKSYDYQINFFYDHNIIIAAHGAELTSIPFLSDNGLIIETVPIGWHPYDYFAGLSFTSSKYHVIVCDDHSCFPKNFNGNCKKDKMNYTIDSIKIIDIIDYYFKNNNKLSRHNCYLI